MIALQRSAGNTSTVALMRRVHDVRDEAPVILTLPEVVDHAGVSSWSIENDGHGRLTRLNITRPTDTDSPRLARAATNGPADVTATLVVRRLTPLGWVRQVTLTMDACMVDSYVLHDDYESVGLSFSRATFDQPGG